MSNKVYLGHDTLWKLFCDEHKEKMENISLTFLKTKCQHYKNRLIAKRPKETFNERKKKQQEKKAQWIINWDNSAFNLCENEVSPRRNIWQLCIYDNLCIYFSLKKG